MRHFEFPQDLLSAYKFISEGELEWESIGSPFNIWSESFMRTHYGGRFGGTSFLSADVFVWGRGEPKDFGVTKIGGVPIWSKIQPFPKETPYYVGQLSFVDSTDLNKLPNGFDLISIWGDEGFPYGDIGLFMLNSNDCMEDGSASVIPLLESVEPFYGSLYHYSDCEVPDKGMDAVEIAHESGAFLYYHPGALYATKIGGIPSCQPTEGEYIAQLTSIQAAPIQQYPWVNRKRPLDLSDIDGNGYTSKKHSLQIGDMGVITIVLNSEGELVAKLSV